ncbi:hypothetical protein CHS0354_012273 [Potamilus streckersoni]|uniref:Uncharacterized protein n=1 Tax=Potamilus streckersoni TaxID=2493646 RepID=A0AAE0W4P8_9BIVA|nr:hypothetical protein CHS0354_012273 [Potamilus streckersoni]
MYWCDANTDKIEKANVDGSNRQPIYQAPQAAHFFGIVLYQSFLYYTDWMKGSVMRINTDGSGLIPVGPPTFGRLNDIHVHKNGFGPQGINGCSNGRGGCSHFCFPRPGGSKVCACPDGMTLQPGGVTCGTSIPCQALQTPMNGQMSPANCTTNSSTPGAQCTVTCNPGFIADISTISCLSNGQWSNYGAPILCRDTQPPTLTCPQNTNVAVPKGKQSVQVTWTAPTATDNSGQAVTLFQTMQSGTTLTEGTYPVTAVATDSSGHTSSCSFTITVTVTHCPQYTPPLNSYVVSGMCSDYYGAVCRIACNPGYQLSGGTTSLGQITCDIDANQRPLWTPNGLSCLALTCPQLTQPPNALLTGCTSPFNVGSVCSQQCQVGSTRTSGSDSRTCLNDGTWSGQPIQCSSQPCPPLIQPVSGSVMPIACTQQQQNVGVICNITCQAGLQLIGASQVTCLASGQWSNMGVPILCTSSGAYNPQGQTRSGSVTDSTTNTAVVAGVVVGIVLLVAIVLGTFIYYKKMQMTVLMTSGGIPMQTMSNTISTGEDNPVYQFGEKDA